MTKQIDFALSPRLQACAMNFNNFMKEHYGIKFGLDNYVSYSIQFSELSPEQFKPLNEPSIPENLKSYIMRFEDGLSKSILESPHYSYSIIFKRKLTQNIREATKVVEFVPYESEEHIGNEEAVKVVTEVVFREGNKYYPKQILEKVHDAGYKLFNYYHHTKLYKEAGAKNPKYGFGMTVG